MQQHLVLLFTIIFVTTFTSCNKNKRNAKTLEGSTWLIIEISIDGKVDSLHPKLEFSEGDIYKEVLSGNWYNSNSASLSSKFMWQFRDKGKTFELSNQSEGDDAVQCSNFSGIYTVTKSSKTNYEFSSNGTFRYNGKTVIIKMDKQ